MYIANYFKIAQEKFEIGNRQWQTLKFHDVLPIENVSFRHIGRRICG